MKILYMGTAAAEGSCPICTHARETGGHNLRTKSQALPDGELFSDFPPDTYSHALRYGLNPGNIHTLLATHSHMDHWFPADHDKREECLLHICKKRRKTVLYGHDTGRDLSDETWELLKQERYDLVSLDATLGNQSRKEYHMGLGIKQGETITVTIEGGSQDANCDTLTRFFADNL